MMTAVSAGSNAIDLPLVIGDVDSRILDWFEDIAQMNAPFPSDGALWGWMATV
jgi:hypothetical protein